MKNVALMAGFNTI